MKKFKPALICAIVLVVVALAALITVKLIPEPNAENPNGGKVDFEVSDSVEIISFETDEIASIEVGVTDGKSFAIDYSGEGVYRKAKMRGDDALAYSEEQMINLSKYFTPLVALDEIGVGNDSDFGFDTPQRTIRISSVSGESKTLIVGDDLPVGDGVYVRRADSDEVFSVGPTVRGLLLKTAQDYRDVTLFSEISDTSVITTAEITPWGKKTIKLEKKTEKEVEDDAERYSIEIAYKLTAPVVANTEPAAASDLLGKIASISGARVAEDNPRDLSKYGLSQPTRLRFETDGGEKVSLLIGKNSENGGTYVMKEGVPSVIETAAKASFSETSVADVVQKLLWFFSSEELDGFEYKLSDGRKFSFLLSKKSGELTGELNGKALSGRNPQNLYMKTVRFTLLGERTENVSLPAPEVTVTARLKNGKSSTLALCKLNERQYAVITDGKDSGFYVAASEVSELLEALSLAGRGEDIPNMF